MGEEGDKIR